MKAPALGMFVLLCLFVLTSAASACTSCYGQTDDKMAQGMNAGIYVLLICIGGVLAAFVGFCIYLARRAATNPLQPAAAETQA